MVSAAHGPEDDHTKGDLGHVTIYGTGMAPDCIHYLWGKERHGTRLGFGFVFVLFFFSFLEKSHQCIKTLVCDIVKAPTILILVSGDNNLWKLHKSGAK